MRGTEKRDGWSRREGRWSRGGKGGGMAVEKEVEQEWKGKWNRRERRWNWSRTGMKEGGMGEKKGWSSCGTGGKGGKMM